MPLLSVTNLEKHFPMRRAGMFTPAADAVRAVDGVSFEVAVGETLGLVGESGSGKSTVGRSLLRAIEPSAGRVVLAVDDEEIDVTALERGALRSVWQHMQLIFQDPYSSLNSRMTVREIVGEPLLVNRITRGRDLAQRVEDITHRCGLNVDHLGRYPHAFSGGQRQRIAIARALVMHPKFIVCDEPVSALDVSIQAQILNLLKDLQTELGLTYLLIAHDLAAVAYACDRVAVMYLGRFVEVAPTRDLFYAPKHPYTEALMSAIPAADPDEVMQPVLLSGDLPDPTNPPPGCHFHPRCRYADEICRSTPPAMTETVPGHLVCCHHTQQLSLAGALARPESGTSPGAPSGNGVP